MKEKVEPYKIMILPEGVRPDLENGRAQGWVYMVTVEGTVPYMVAARMSSNCDVISVTERYADQGRDDETVLEKYKSDRSNPSQFILDADKKMRELAREQAGKLRESLAPSIDDRIDGFVR